MPPPPTPAVPKTAPTGGGLTGPSPDRNTQMTFSAKKRFFEKEIEESVQPAAKPGNLIAAANLPICSQVSY